MKKFGTLVLALALCAGLTAPASAAGGYGPCTVTDYNGDEFSFTSAKVETGDITLDWFGEVSVQEDVTIITVQPGSTMTYSGFETGLTGYTRTGDAYTPIDAYKAWVPSDTPVPVDNMFGVYEEWQGNVVDMLSFYISFDSETGGQDAYILLGGGAAPADQPSSWAAEQVNAAIEAGIVPESLQTGYTNTATRAQFCALAVELYETVTGSEIAERAEFTDTTDVNVQKMAGLGVINGVGGGQFNPNGELTREQAATILVRLADAMGHPLPEGTASFADNASIASWALDAVGRAQAGGLMGGIGNNQFSPQGPYTVEQSIMTAFRLYETVQ